MRPVYETQNDRDNEAAVIQAVCQRWNCTAVKSPALSGSDVYFDRGDTRLAHAEIKCRTHTFKTYPDFFISAAKLRSGLERARLARVVYVLIVRFTDGIYWAYINEATVADWCCRPAGRDDRNDKRDKELCVFIPLKKFKPMNKPKNHEPKPN